MRTLGAVSSPPRCVLVVDDNPTVRDLIRINLELDGYTVVTAGDGEEALELVERVHPDLITLDVTMPRLDGLAVATRLKGRPDTNGIPLVMVSARAQAADLARGERAGVDAYITKPFDPCELMTTVGRLLGAPAPSSEPAPGSAPDLDNLGT
jgi:CheY-like chemotaxis protein